MDWKKKSKDAARKMAGDWEAYTSEKFLDLMEDWQNNCSEDLPNEYMELRSSLFKFDEGARNIKRETGSTYLADLHMGLKLYEYTISSMDMSPCHASDDDIWRYIQMEVVPGLIMKRWAASDESKRVNNDRIWESTRRIWLKVLWWYVHLSWQGSTEETEKVLKNVVVDMSQLVERSGKGYRTDLYRSIMKRLATSKGQNDLLKKVLKLNVVNCSSTEPMLYEGGVEEYVKTLFNFFEE